ncbi:DUF4352 domain-containing protein [Goekera deserti]|uniref:DUF4352 domain-containing protein n=1 Tax=Goekera deserti TaxID=2497753 RepID=A0A7K3WG13_9ACTN|nr:DUF4352 domain-containing protein [Goekera deserti]NDI47172.1 DUF4352 domain-containing protein [Goekera deserti]NEL55428.1 DUF4352 domain-containing protein [Goekera deserti]
MEISTWLLAVALVLTALDAALSDRSGRVTRLGQHAGKLAPRRSRTCLRSVALRVVARTRTKAGTSNVTPLDYGPPNGDPRMRPFGGQPGPRPHPMPGAGPHHQFPGQSPHVYGPIPTAYLPPPKPPFYKRPWVLVCAGLFLFGAVLEASETDGRIAGSGPASASGQVTPDAAQTDVAGADVDGATPAPQPVDPPAPRLGEAVADGDLSFVVHGIDCSVTTIGGRYLNATAQGTFCVVDLTVHNIGDEAQRFSGDDSTLYNAQGQEYSADVGAALYLEDAQSFYEQINPGNALDAKIVFDVPSGMIPTSIELHDSPFSTGVSVELR